MLVELCCLGAPLFSVGFVVILNAQTQLLALFIFFRPCPLSLTYTWHLAILMFRTLLNHSLNYNGVSISIIQFLDRVRFT